MEQRPFDSSSSTSSGLGTTSGGSSPEGTSAVKEQGRQLARRAVGEVKSRLAEVTDERKSQATGTLEAIGRTLRQAGDNLRQEGLEPVGDLGVRAAERVDRMANYLRRQDMDGLLRDVQRVARNHPEVFLGGALLCGVLIGRFLRSSAPSTHEVVFEPDFQLEGGSIGGSSVGTSYGDGQSGSFGSGLGGERPPRGDWA